MIVVPYDPRWPEAFEAERDRIRVALGALALRIDHYGSTAVPGLAAKPIIDIQIAVERLHPIEPYVGALATIGYRHLAHADDAFCPFFHRPGAWPHTHHVHIVEAGGEEERRTLAFRDYLRAHVEVAREYEALKEKLAGQFDGESFSSREAYANAKGAFINRVLRRSCGGRSHVESQPMETHVKVLGALQIALGVFALLWALVIVLAFGVAAGLVGVSGDPESAFALPIIGITGMALVAFLVTLSLPSIIIGVGLFRLRPWARIAGIVLSILGMTMMPFGTIVGVYGLWVLFSKDTERLFTAAAPASPLG